MQLHDGQVIDLAGELKARKPKAIDNHRLILADGTTVVLVGIHERTTDADSGKRLVVRGRIFTAEIPESYQIIGRTAEPYLVNITAVTREP